MRIYALKIGDRLIDDILNPHHTQIDPDAIDVRLRAMHRFSNDPAALTVHTHRVLVRLLASIHKEPDDVLQWCWHHDDHEAIIGDIPGPLKALIGDHTPILNQIEAKLDEAICIARCLRHPTDHVRRAVHYYDKMAETIEWLHVLHQPPARWNMPCPLNTDEMLELLAEARSVA